MDFVPNKRNSVLFPLSLRKLCENQVLTFCRQSRREGGGSEEPESVAMRRSLVILARAVLVL